VKEWKERLVGHGCAKGEEPEDLLQSPSKRPRASDSHLFDQTPSTKKQFQELSEKDYWTRFNEFQGSIAAVQEADEKMGVEVKELQISTAVVPATEPLRGGIFAEGPQDFSGFSFAGSEGKLPEELQKSTAVAPEVEVKMGLESKELQRSTAVVPEVEEKMGLEVNELQRSTAVVQDVEEKMGLEVKELQTSSGAPIDIEKNGELELNKLEERSVSRPTAQTLVFELARDRPLRSMRTILDFASKSQGVASLREFLEACIFESVDGGSDFETFALQDWCEAVLASLPGVVPAKGDEGFLKTLRNISQALSENSEAAHEYECLDHGCGSCPGFHLSCSDLHVKASIALIVSALQRRKCWPKGISVLYHAHSEEGKCLCEKAVRLHKGVGAQKKVLIYGIGYPGSGKSSAFRTAMAGVQCMHEISPFPMAIYENGVAMLGRWQFAKNDAPCWGSDSMAPFMKPAVLGWMRQAMPKLVLVEGDRFNHKDFFEKCTGMGYEIKMVFFDVPAEVTRERYQTREDKEANPGWYKGKITQVNSTRELFKDSLTVIDGLQDKSLVAKELKEFIFQRFEETGCEVKERTEGEDCFVGKGIIYTNGDDTIVPEKKTIFR
jgi:hypothetical protein